MLSVHRWRLPSEDLDAYYYLVAVVSAFNDGHPDLIKLDVEDVFSVPRALHPAIDKFLVVQIPTLCDVLPKPVIVISDFPGDVAVFLSRRGSVGKILLLEHILCPLLGNGIQKNILFQWVHIIPGTGLVGKVYDLLSSERFLEGMYVWGRRVNLGNPYIWDLVATTICAGPGF